MFKFRPLVFVMVAIVGFTMMACDECEPPIIPEPLGSSDETVEVGNSNPEVEWEFVDVYQHSFDQKDSTDPEASYACVLSSNEDSGTFQSGIKYSDVQSLLARYDVETPNELKGKTFKFTDRPNYVFMYLDYLITEQKHGGQYTPPSDQELYDRAFRSLSRMFEPNFSDIDRYTVFLAFMRVFKEDSDRKDFIQKLINRVSELSHGQVQIIKDEESPSNRDFFFLSKVAEGSKRYRFTINRYPDNKEPFIFVYK